MRAIPEGEFHRKYYLFYSTLLERGCVYYNRAHLSHRAQGWRGITRGHRVSCRRKREMMIVGEGVPFYWSPSGAVLQAWAVQSGIDISHTPGFAPSSPVPLGPWAWAVIGAGGHATITGEGAGLLGGLPASPKPRFRAGRSVAFLASGCGEMSAGALTIAAVLKPRYTSSTCALLA